MGLGATCLWLSLDGLYILSNAVKPSARRRLFLLPIVAIATYGFLAKPDTGNQFANYGLGTRVVAVIMLAVGDLFLCQPQKDLRMKKDKGKKPVSERSFMERLRWSLTLWWCARGVGWEHEPKGAVIPPRLKTKSRADFVRQQLLWIAVDILVFDLNGLINRSNPFYNVAPLPVSGFGHLWRLYACGYGILLRLNMSMQYKVLSIICILLGYTEPEDWPPAYGSYLEAFTLKRLWGITWHQQFRRTFLLHGSAIAKSLNLRPNGTASNLVVLFAGFFLSGVMHYAGDVYMMNDWRAMGGLAFFILQALGIVIETALLSLARSLGLNGGKRTLLTRSIGYLWVLLWISWTLPFWTDTQHRFGMREWMPRYSLIYRIWKGEWMWT